MSEADVQQVYEPLPPFSFKGWEEETELEGDVDFAERWVERCAEEVTHHLSEGRNDLAELEEHSLAWWRGLEHLSSEEGKTLDLELDHDVGKLIDALLARAKVSEDAARNLFTLGSKLFDGLSALAKRSDQTAARMLVLTLRDAVDSFNLVAHSKPEIFTQTTREMHGIPGVISRNKEQIQRNEELFVKLQVTKGHPLTIYHIHDRKVPKLTTPVNRWAVRLYNYLENARRLVAVDWSRPTKTPEWAERAAKLAPFSVKTSDEWEEVAWLVIMEATGNVPEDEPHLFAIGKSGENKKPIHGFRYKARSKRANVRHKIRVRFQEAFRQLAIKDLSLL